MRFVSCMRVDPSTPVSALSAIAKRLDSYLQTHPYVEDGVFEEMSQLAQKLCNDALVEQCQVRTKHYFVTSYKQTNSRPNHKGEIQRDLPHLLCGKTGS